MGQLDAVGGLTDSSTVLNKADQQGIEPGFGMLWMCFYMFLLPVPVTGQWLGDRETVCALLPQSRRAGNRDRTMNSRRLLLVMQRLICFKM